MRTVSIPESSMICDISSVTSPPAPGGERSGAGAVVVNNKLYVVGGFTPPSSYLTDVDCYDPATNTWTPRAPLPVGLYSMSVIAFNDQLWVVGGSRFDGFTNPDIYVYDPIGNSWDTYTPSNAPGGITAPSLAFFDLQGKWAVENEGIAPDVEVEYTPADVLKGHDPQLERAVQEALKLLEQNPSRRIPRPAPIDRVSKQK